jgi:hypothetical protein
MLGGDSSESDWAKELYPVFQTAPFPPDCATSLALNHRKIRVDEFLEVGGLCNWTQVIVPALLFQILKCIFCCGNGGCLFQWNATDFLLSGFRVYYRQSGVVVSIPDPESSNVPASVIFDLVKRLLPPGHFRRLV